MIEMFLLLAAGHFLADFGLQNDFVARNKCNALSTAMGFWTMTAHAMMHGLVAAAVLGFLGHDWLVPFAGVVVTHWLIDLGKCRRWYGITIDQVLHLSVLLIVMTVVS